MPTLKINSHPTEVNESTIIQGVEEIDLTLDIECCDCRRTNEREASDGRVATFPALIKARLVTMDVFLCALHSQTRGVF